jgi:hypothetical protein
LSVLSYVTAVVLSVIQISSSVADGLSFPSAATSPPGRSSYRSQPEYVAMKPSVVASDGPSDVSEIIGGSSGERTGQTTCKAVREISVACHTFEMLSLQFLISRL